MAQAVATPSGYDYTKFIGDHQTTQPPSQPTAVETGRNTGHVDVVEAAAAKPMYPQQGSQQLTNANAIPASGSNQTHSQTPIHVSSADTIDKEVYGQKADVKDNYAGGQGTSDVRGSHSQPTSVKNYVTSYGNDPKADYILVFKLPTRGAPADEWKSAEGEYDRLRKYMRDQGLLTMGVPGKEGRDERLLLIKASSSMLYAEAQKEKLDDWLSASRGATGTAAIRHKPHQIRDFGSQPLLSSERLRLVHFQLERALHWPHEQNPFPRVLSYFPPQDHDFNTRWLRNWSTATSSDTGSSIINLIKIPEEQLVAVRDHFGSGVAMYFEFLRFYFLALAFPTFVGMTTWLGGHHFSKLYSSLILVWSVVTVEGWRLRERQLAVRWGNFGISRRGTVRLGFKAEDVMVSPITGQKVPYSPWWRREAKVAATIPALLGFAAILAAVISVIFSTEVIINEVYKGPFKGALSFVPIVLFASVVPQVIGAWRGVSAELTDWENHPTETGHDRSLTLKNFALNSIVSYGALTLTAYVYLPFGSFIVPFFVRIIRGRLSEQSLSMSSLSNNVNFAASPQRLTNTLFALMTTTQAIGAFTEIVLPYAQRKWIEYQNQPSHSPSSSNQQQHQQANSAAKTPQQKEGTAPSVNNKNQKASRYTSMGGLLTNADKKTWLQRIHEEVELPEYKLFDDYAEMAIQFGHVVLWSTAWPLAPLAAFINNFFELRGDAFKLCVNSRRPVPQRVDTIGPWLEALSWITYLGALTNASLIYLLRPQLVVASGVPSLSDRFDAVIQGNLTAAINATVLAEQKLPRIISKEGNDTSSVRSVLLGALLCALASEHAFVLIRYGIAHLLDMLMWRGSAEELTLRESEWKLRKDYLDSRGAKAFEKEIDRLKGLKEEEHSRAADDNDIWLNAPDAGVREAIDRKNQ